VKNLLVLICICGALQAASLTATANLYTFKPDGAFLSNLPQDSYYTLGIIWSGQDQPPTSWFFVEGSSGQGEQPVSETSLPPDQSGSSGSKDEQPPDEPAGPPPDQGNDVLDSLVENLDDGALVPPEYDGQPDGNGEGQEPPVEAIPAPAAVLLGVIGLAGIGLFRRKLD